MAGSISKPKVVAAGLNVMVRAVWSIGEARTSGVAVSVSGGIPQADHVPGTANCVRGAEKVNVWPPLTSEVTGGPEMTTGTTVVLPVYCAVGEEMV